MKKVVLLWVALFGLLGVQRAEAQSWLDALKGVATEALDEVTGGKLTEVAIVGTWNYQAPGIRMGSSDTMTNLAGAAVESTIEGKLQGVYQKVGFVPGFCSITFEQGEAFTMTLKGKSIEGTYLFDAATHKIDLQIGKLKIPASGFVYMDGQNLELVFPADKLVQFITAVGSRVSSLSTLAKSLENYDEVYCGFQFGK